MRRAVSTVGAFVLATGLLGAGYAGAENTEQGAGDPPTRQQAIARSQRAINHHPGKAHISKPAEISVTDVIVDPDGDTHVRYKRTYRGLPVIGGDFVVHNGPDGGFKRVSVHMDESISIDTKPSVSPGQAKQAAKNHFEGTIDEVNKPSLVVHAGIDEPALAWEVLVTGMKPDGQTPSRLHVLVDATSAEVLGSSDEIKSANDHGVYVGTVEVDTTGTGGRYELKDPSHGNGYTCDMNNGTFTCETMYDQDDSWGTGDPRDEQSAAVDAHYGAAMTYDYFNDVHGRCGIFGNCEGVPSRVHYGDNYVNAFWNGSSMTYGDGRNNANPLTELDVAGHEMSHGVTEATAGLCYTNADCGGLNEATSDIFGSMVEFYANNAQDTPDYDIGEEIDINGNGTPLRYMYHPSLDGRSYDCWAQGRSADPHYTSGPGNHFFFMLAEGSGQTEYGTSPTCDGSTVQGIGRQKAQQIWFQALSTQFTSYTTYPEAREGTLAVATDLYGTCSAEYQGVQAAWNAVSVPGNDSPCQGEPDPQAPSASFTSSCAETACDFDATASTDPDGSIVSYAWNFGDSATDTGATTSHTYTDAGTYTVTLTVTDNSGNTDTASKNVEIGSTGPKTCSNLESTHSGQLNNGDIDIQPDDSYFHTTTNGQHTACLNGPDGTDFDLYLQKWNGYFWTDVASGTTPGPDETLTHTGTPGYYRYQIHAYNGSGHYTLGYNTP